MMVAEEIGMQDKSEQYDAATVARFWSKVRKTDGCWLWEAAKIRGGYGAFRIAPGSGQRKVVYAHRMAWEMTHGPIPGDRVCGHTCGERACVNPAHLMLTTQSERLLETYREGQFPIKRGGAHPHSTLTDEQALELLERAWAGATNSELMADFRVSYYTVSDIVSGKGWTHLPRPEGIPRHAENRRMTEEQRALLRDLHKQGLTVKQISVAHNVPERSLYRLFADLRDGNSRSNSGAKTAGV